MSNSAAGAASWERISFENNYLNGTIPAQWSTLISGNATVKFISLANNLLQGQIPASWSAFLANTTNLQLQGNFLEGSIPANWTAVTNTTLTQLLLQDNPCLCGPLPAWVGQVAVANTSNTNQTAGCVAGAVCNRLPGPAPAHPDAAGRQLIQLHLPCFNTLPGTYHVVATAAVSACNVGMGSAPW